MVTGDRDLFQLVDDARDGPRLLPARGIHQADVVDEAAVAASAACRGRAYADLATLRSDPSDGLPGVAGIGEKTAASLITKYGVAAGAARRPGRRRRRDPRRARAPSSGRGRDYLGVAAEGRRRGRRTCRCPTLDDARTATPRDPDALVGLSPALGAGQTLSTRCSGHWLAGAAQNC